MAKQNSTYGIESFEDSWEKNPIDGRPQSGRQIREFLGEKYHDTDSRLAKLEEAMEVGNLEFKFINMPSGNIVVNGTTPYLLPLQVRSMLVQQDGSEEEYDRNVTLTIDVILNGNISTSVIGNVAANEDITVNVTPYVADGSTFVLRATNADGNSARSPYYDVTKANIGITSRGDGWWSAPFVKGQSWNIPLSINVNVNAMLKAKMLDSEGVVRSSKSVSSTSLSENYDLVMQHPSENGGANGIYTLRIEMTATDENLAGLAADPLEYKIVCTTATDDKNYLIVNNKGKEFKNYVTNRMFDYMVKVGYGNPTVCFTAYEGETVIATTGEMSVTPNAVTPYNLALELERMDDSDFDVKIVATLDGETAYEETFTFTNKEGYAAIAGATTLIRFNGRSNAETSRETLINTADGTEINPEFTGMGWTGADGYRNETLADGSVRTALRLLAGSRMVLPVKPLAMRANEGRTIEFVYKTNNVRNFESDVISIKDGNNGLTINSNEVVLYTPSAQQHDDQNAGVDYTDIMHVAVVVRPLPNGSTETVDNFSACQIYINGCRQRWFAYDKDLSIDKPITFGSDEADIDLYAVRIYEKVLSEAEIEQNACNMLPTEAEKRAFKTRNAVRENGKVDFARVRSLCNVIVFGCDELPARAWDKDKNTAATIETYVLNGASSIESVENLAWQGTTSHNYGTNPEYGGLGQNYKWTAEDGTKMCAKANWASSMQSHKIALTAAYTDLAVACDIIPASQRISILQKPFAGFQRKSDGTLMFIGTFTVGPDKGNKNTFGWTSKSLFLEGSDNEPLGTNFLTPWNNDTVTVDSENEKYSVMGVKSWEDASKKPEYIESVWKPAYNFVYGCSQHIKPYSGAVADMKSANLEVSYSYWLTANDGGAAQYDLMYYNATREAWMSADINMKEQLAGKGYGIEEADLEGKSAEELNEMFKNARKEKFKQEFEQYFSKAFAIYHTCFGEFFACTDNLSKNTYPFVLDCTQPNHVICWRQDDLDSSLMTENQGKNYKKYCVEVNDNYSEYGRDNLMVFNGTNNQFWLLVRETLADEISKFMQEKFIKNLKYGQGDYEAWCQHYFFDNAQSHFPEALYNETGRIRYGYGHLSVGYQYRGIALSQDSGNCYSAEKQWLRMRYIYMCSKYLCGQFLAGHTGDTFTTRPYKAENGVGNTYEITPAIYMYPSVQNGQTAIRGHRIYPGSADKSWTVTLPATEGDQEQRIMGMSYIKTLGDMYTAAIRNAVDVNGKMLQELQMGTLTDTTHIRSRITGIGIGDATSLQELNLANLTTLAGVVDLTQCASLIKVYADKTSVTNVQLCEGGNLTTLHLPATTTTMSLVGKKKMSDLVVEGIGSLSSFEMRNCNDYATQKGIEILSELYMTPLERLDKYGYGIWTVDGDFYPTKETWEEDGSPEIDGICIVTNRGRCCLRISPTGYTPVENSSYASVYAIYNAYKDFFNSNKTYACIQIGTYDLLMDNKNFVNFCKEIYPNITNQNYYYPVASARNSDWVEYPKFVFGSKSDSSSWGRALYYQLRKVPALDVKLLS